MKSLWILLGVVVLALAAYFLFTEPEPATAPIESNGTTTLDGGSAGVDGPEAGVLVVTYSETGFSPETITVPVGTTVTWVNESGGQMWIAADEHPTHTSYDGTSRSEHCANSAPTDPSVFDQCAASATFAFTFTQDGTWEYHNHANASVGGTVIVTNDSAAIDADVQVQ